MDLWSLMLCLNGSPMVHLMHRLAPTMRGEQQKGQFLASSIVLTKWSFNINLHVRSLLYTHSWCYFIYFLIHLIYSSESKWAHSLSEQRRRILFWGRISLQPSQTLISSSDSEMFEKYGSWSAELFRARGRTCQPVGLCPPAASPPPLGVPVGPATFPANPGPGSAHPQCP